jgi:hypothetical protein
MTGSSMLGPYKRLLDSVLAGPLRGCRGGGLRGDDPPIHLQVPFL